MGRYLTLYIVLPDFSVHPAIYGTKRTVPSIGAALRGCRRVTGLWWPMVLHPYYCLFPVSTYGLILRLPTPIRIK